MQQVTTARTKKNWHGNSKCRSFFYLFIIFSSRRTINLLTYAETSLALHFEKKFNKVSDKLLGQLLVLMAAKLKIRRRYSYVIRKESKMTLELKY